MHWNSDTFLVFDHSNVGTSLPNNGETEALEGFDRFGAGEIARNFHAGKRIGSLTKWRRIR